MERLEVEIHDLSRGGAGVGKTPAGQIVFVPYTAPGDLAQVEIVESKKNYLQGRLLSLSRTSPDRVEPRCPVFGSCGGCEWQHLPYALQWSTKKNGALHALKRAGVSYLGSVEEFPALNPWNYRNRIQLRGLKDEIGFRKKGSTELVAIASCDIARNEINQAIPSLKNEGKKFEKEYKLEIQVNENGKIEHAWNSSHAALGFRQINDDQNEVLKKWVKKNITKQRELLDLYGGSGNLSVDLRDEMKQIECVDVTAPRENSTTKMKFHKWPVEKWISRQFLSPSKSPRSAIIDPPREGLGKNLKVILSELSRVCVNEVILVGCDEDSWARDCSGFQKLGWKLEKIALFDLFPQTHHLESVAKWVK